MHAQERELAANLQKSRTGKKSAQLLHVNDQLNYVHFCQWSLLCDVQFLVVIFCTYIEYYQDISMYEQCLLIDLVVYSQILPEKFPLLQSMLWYPQPVYLAMSLRWTNIKNMYFHEIQSLPLVLFTETVNHSWFLLGCCCRLLWGIFTKWLVFGNCADYFRTCCLHFPLSPTTNGEYALPPTHTQQSVTGSPEMGRAERRATS